MALTLDATPGGANANTYVSLDAAALYFEGRPGSDVWDAATDTERQRALLAATQRLDTIGYRGVRSSDAQALSWPRYGVFYDGVEIADDVIPTCVIRATCEEALAYLASPERDDTNALAGFDSLTVGPIRLDIAGGGGGASLLTPIATRLLAPVRAGGGRRSFVVERA